MSLLRIDGDNVIFSTGKKIYANNGIIGLSPNLKVSEGYDGGIDNNELTSEEKLELSEYMLAAWNEYKLKIPGKVRGYR